MSWPLRIATLKKGGRVTLLRREGDGTVTVVSIATPRTISLMREANGTVTCS